MAANPADPSPFVVTPPPLRTTLAPETLNAPIASTPFVTIEVPVAEIPEPAPVASSASPSVAASSSVTEPPARVATPPASALTPFDREWLTTIDAPVTEIVEAAPEA